MSTAFSISPNDFLIGEAARLSHTVYEEEDRDIEGYELNLADNSMAEILHPTPSGQESLSRDRMSARAEVESVAVAEELAPQVSDDTTVMNNWTVADDSTMETSASASVEREEKRRKAFVNANNDTNHQRTKPITTEQTKGRNNSPPASKKDAVFSYSQPQNHAKRELFKNKRKGASSSTHKSFLNSMVKNVAFQKTQGSKKAIFEVNRNFT